MMMRRQDPVVADFGRIEEKPGDQSPPSEKLEGGIKRRLGQGGNVPHQAGVEVSDGGVLVVALDGGQDGQALEGGFDPVIHERPPQDVFICNHYRLDCNPIGTAVSIPPP